jgi:hypothetical protein
MAVMEEALKEAMQEQPTTTHTGLSREQLKEALKKFKAEKDDVQDPKVGARILSLITCWAGLDINFLNHLSVGQV